jgi:hypothetical protein
VVFQIEQQKTIRPQGGTLVRQEARPEPAQAGVLTVIGLLPKLCKEPTIPASQSPTPPRSPPAPYPEAAEILTPLVRPTRSLLTLTDKPSVRRAGLEADERRHDVGS